MPQGTTLSFSNSSIKNGTVTKTDGASNFTIAVTKKTLAADKGAVSWSSSDKSVATVDSASGQVTVKNDGETTITATKAATANKYAAHKASYKLVVEPGTKISYPEAEVTQPAVSSGTKVATQTLSKEAESEDSGAITYALSEVKDGSSPANTPANVVTINTNTGEITIKKAGSARVTATKAATSGVYKERTASYVVTFTLSGGS